MFHGVWFYTETFNQEREREDALLVSYFGTRAVHTQSYRHSSCATMHGHPTSVSQTPAIPNPTSASPICQLLYTSLS